MIFFQVSPKLLLSSVQILIRHHLDNNTIEAGGAVPRAQHILWPAVQSHAGEYKMCISHACLDFIGSLLALMM